MLSTSSNKSETCIFILQKGRGNVNFRQQQRSLIKLYMRVHLLTLKRRKKICKKSFLVISSLQFQIEHRQDLFLFHRTQTNFFWQCITKLLVTKFVCRLKNDKAQKIETWEQNSKCKKVNIILVRKIFFPIFLNHLQIDNIWEA